MSRIKLFKENTAAKKRKVDVDKYGSGKPKKTKSGSHIGFVLDGSGSMGPYVYATITGFNHFLAETSKDMKGDDCLFSMVCFSSAMGNRHNNLVILADSKPINYVLPLNKHKYKTGGGTPLYDTIHRTIHNVQKWKSQNPNGQPIIVAQTDGHDTTSTVLPETLKKLIEEKKKEGWIFIFIGMGVSAEKMAAQIGIEAERALSYSDEKIKMAFDKLSIICRKASGAEEGEPIFSLEDKRDTK